MKNLLVCTLLFAYAFTLNAQVANTRIYAAEKLAKVCFEVIYKQFLNRQT